MNTLLATKFDLGVGFTALLLVQALGTTLVLLGQRKAARPRRVRRARPAQPQEP